MLFFPTGFTASSGDMKDGGKRIQLIVVIDVPADVESIEVTDRYIHSRRNVLVADLRDVVLIIVLWKIATV